MSGRLRFGGLLVLCGWMVSVAALSGCQTTGESILPWTKRLSDSGGSPGGAVSRSDDSASVFQQTAHSKDTGETAAARDRDDRVQQWLERGRQALSQAGNSPERSVLLAEATDAFRQVLRLDSDNAAAWHGLAIVSDLNEDWDLAEMNYKRALALRRDDVHLLNDLGYSYLLQKRYDEASRYLARALQIDPHYEKASINLAILDVQRGRREQALARLTDMYPADQAHRTFQSIVQQYDVQQDDTGDVNDWRTAGMLEDRQQPAAPTGPVLSHRPPGPPASGVADAVPQSLDRSSRHQVSPSGPGGMIRSTPGPESLPTIRPGSGTADSVSTAGTETAPGTASAGFSVSRPIVLPPQTAPIPPWRGPVGNRSVSGAGGGNGTMSADHRPTPAFAPAAAVRSDSGGSMYAAPAYPVGPFPSTMPSQGGDGQVAGAYPGHVSSPTALPSGFSTRGQTAGRLSGSSFPAGPLPNAGGNSASWEEPRSFPAGHALSGQIDRTGAGGGAAAWNGPGMSAPSINPPAYDPAGATGLPSASIPRGENGNGSGPARAGLTGTIGPSAVTPAAYRARTATPVSAERSSAAPSGGENGISSSPAPPYFAPGPLHGDGYRDPRADNNDPIRQYRSVQQQEAAGMQAGPSAGPFPFGPVQP